MNDPYYILLAFSILVILSYLFNVISNFTRIPSVLLLLGTGIGLKYAVIYTALDINFKPVLLELLGITGLIFIVLEGSLDLKISKAKLPLIGKSFFSALFTFLVCSASVAWLIKTQLDTSWINSIVYAIPMGVVSSAIAIPSVTSFSEEKREFIVYESTFSDILGIMIFNYAIMENARQFSSLISFTTSFVVIIIISIAATAALLLLLHYVRAHVKFFLVFAVIILVYALGKMFHLPSLLLVLIFGLTLNNANHLVKGKIANYLHIEKLNIIREELKLITGETAFLIRTFFFLLFGFSIELSKIIQKEVLFAGSMIILLIFITRAVFLLLISRSNLFPGIFIAPRGLITVILFYSIPVTFKIGAFSEGVLFFVILVSSILMMFGLLFSGRSYKESIDNFMKD